MAFDRTDLSEVVAKQTKPRIANPQKMIQAAVAAENLMGDPLWDFYLSILQTWLDTYEAHLEGLKEDFGKRHLGTEAERLDREVRAKVQYARVTLLKEILAIPQKLKENGRVAADELKARASEDDAA